jgi:hypothetical protein
MAAVFCLTSKPTDYEMRMKASNSVTLLRPQDRPTEVYLLDVSPGLGTEGGQRQ